MLDAKDEDALWKVLMKLTRKPSGVVQPMATIYVAEAVEALRKQAAVQPQTLKRFE